MSIGDAQGLWNKIKNHVGVKVEYPISLATRQIRSRLSDEGVQKTASVCPYCAVGCSTFGLPPRRTHHRHRGQPRQPHKRRYLVPQGLGHLRAARLPLPLDEGQIPQALLRPLGGPLPG